jgi:hypothetical protein
LKVLIKNVVPGLVFFSIILGMSSAFADHELEKVKCPQNRQTLKAPEEYLDLVNPLPVTAKRIEKGELIYQTQASPLQCRHCHGRKGNGAGHMGLEANPPARNFECSETMKNVSDGQMFWAIKNGIPGTAMPAYPDLADWKIWVLIHYIRSFAPSGSLDENY